MNQTLSMEQVFLNRLNEIIESNLHNEQFGVAEISREIGLSRSGVHRRLKSIVKKSLTQYVREYRLRKAMEMLRHHEATAAEIAFRVGFSSPAYFNKCFHEYYGYPPGEVRKLEMHESESPPFEPEPEVLKQNNSKKKIFTILSVTFFALLILLLLFYFSDFSLFKNLIGSRVDRIKDLDQSIVVLPFKNLSEDPGNQYFADGVMEDILNNLIRIRDIRVISRTTAEHFRGSSLTSPQIAEELHVGFVLEGSVLKYENKARIFVQLIDARHDQHIWSEKYDRELSDVFFIQTDIAKNIAHELEAVLSEKEIERIDKVPTRSSPAYDLYLRGRFFWNKRTEEGLKKAIVYFEQSVAADPDYALAYAGLADAYFIQSVWKWCPRANGYARAKLMAQKAIEIDNNLAEAHATLGGVFTWWDWKWEDARKEFLFAISCNPDYAMTRQYYAELLFLLGENEEARRQINIALELDPLSLINRQVSAYQFYCEGRTAEAMDEIKIIQEIDSTFVSSLWILWKIFIAKGEGIKALEVVQKIYGATPKLKNNEKGLKIAFDKAGINSMIQYVMEIEKKNPYHSYNIALYYAQMKEYEKALEWLEKAYDEHTIINVLSDPEFEDIRTDPRCWELMKKMGFTDYFTDLSVPKDKPHN